jgi:hypothetical protein
MANWTVTHHDPGVTVQRDGVTVWHDADAGSYTAEAWRTVLRDLGDMKMRMYAAEDSHREAIARLQDALAAVIADRDIRVRILQDALATAIARAEAAERGRDDAVATLRAIVASW